MIKPGDVFRFHDYKFTDGSKQDKLFVILNDYTSDGSAVCLTVITTSQERHYSNVLEGCNLHKAVFMIPKDRECFPKDTYIKMLPIYPFSLGKVLKESIGKVIEDYGNLSDRCLCELLRCLNNFKDDIAAEHYKILFPR